MDIEGFPSGVVCLTKHVFCTVTGRYVFRELGERESVFVLGKWEEKKKKMELKKEHALSP